MMKNNIFAGSGARSAFVNLIYTELMKRDFVSYADILALYCGRPKGYYKIMACNGEPGYGELKKAFPFVPASLMTTPLIISYLQISKTSIGNGLETSCLRRSALFQYVKYLMQR